MKTLKYVFLLLLLLFVAGAVYIATLDSSYDVTRTKIIKAPSEVVYKYVNDYKNWPAWSPWIEKEPSATLTYGDKTMGEGANYNWSGEILGEGSMETIESKFPDSIKQKITFITPFESESDIYWNFKPTDEGVEVVWGMKGKMDFFFKAFSAFNGGMDKQIGPDFERGLFKLDSVVEVDMKKYSITTNGISTRGGGYYLYTTTSCKINEMAEKMMEMIPLATTYALENNIPLAGAPFTLYHQFDTENNAVIFSCAIPISEKIITAPNSGIQTGLLKPFRAVKITLKGNYDYLKEAWDSAYKFIAENNLEPTVGVAALEVYLTDSLSTPNPADWVTEIFVPVNQ